MKYTTLATLLPLAASVTNAENSKRADVTFNVENFSAECNDYSVYCWYNFEGFSSSNNPGFGQGCSVLNTSQSGLLPAVGVTQCGTYRVSVEKPDDAKKGALVLTVYLRKDKLVGTYAIAADDLTITKTEGGKTVQSYKGKKAITIAAHTNPNPVPEPVDQHFTDPASTAPVPEPTSSPTGSALSPSATTTDAAAASKASQTMATEASKTASPSATPNAAARGSAFAGASFVAGLMAFAL
ncbi:hypothetical protein PGQ11_014895 [Apiospora arundinis]|uniref:Uncharacterized protein n=1 Tax=Apiospora arundinis TaxID=335852 RepID=A0ABR2HKE4_9PEZI